MGTYTWIEVPTWVFHSGETQLTRMEVKFVFQLCSKANETGFVSVDDLAIISLELGFGPEDIIPILEKLENARFMFRFAGSGGEIGNYVNFSDDKQCLALFNTHLEEGDDSVRRIIFPFEISMDERLGVEDLHFLGLCLTYSDPKDKSYIASDIVMAFIGIFDLELNEVKNTMHKLETLNYLKISQDPPGLFMPWQYPQ